MILINYMYMKKKITTVAYFDVNQKNGGAIFAKNIHNFLNETEDFESVIYCNNRGPISETAYKNEKLSLKIKLIPILSKLKDRLKNSVKFELIIHFIRNDVNAITLALKLFFKRNFDNNSIFLFHDYLSFFYFSLFHKSRKRKTVLIMHNDGSPAEMVSSGLKKQWKKKILNRITHFQIKFILKNTSKIVFLCENAKNKFINLYKVETEKTVTIPNGVGELRNISPVEKKDKVIRFITVCTMNTRKGIDILIKCIPLINDKFESKVLFNLIGQGPLLENLKQLSLKYPNVCVVGESDKINDFLMDSDVFFLLSRNEGQPLSIVEALRASLFIIATDVGCNSSMVNESNGLLVDVDEEQIINAFTKVILDWDNLKSKGKNSFTLFNEKFTEKKMYQEYMNVFKAI